MSDNDFDVIVVGAGFAGLCCAGELVLRGKRPLLVCETEEVGHTMRSEWVAGNRAVMQHPVSTTGWGGGWWIHLVRALNLDVRLHPGAGFHVTIRGTGELHHVPLGCASAATITRVISEFSPLPIDDVREELEQVLHAALAIPYKQLLQMQGVPVTEWLRDQGASETVSALALALCAPMAEFTVSEATEHLSVFGAFSLIRTMLCGESTVYVVEPDVRDGLCIPIADEVERRGGTVWRGRKVARVLTDGGRASGVVLEDGTEARAPIVAIACGNPRIGALLDPLPPEIDAALTYSAASARDDFTMFAVLDKPVVTDRGNSYLGVMSPDGSVVQWDWLLHEASPWTVKPGQQFLACQKLIAREEVEKFGGEEAIYAEMHDVLEELYPGFKGAIVEVTTQRHRHLWVGPFDVGPKLPRTIDSIEDLWFVGDGSAPIGGVFMDAAASAGILGARAMVGSTSTEPIAAD